MKHSSPDPFRVALVRPDVPADFPLGRMRATLPLGLLVLAGCLRQAGCEVVILDDHLEQRGAEWIAAQVRVHRADMVGISINLATVQTSSLLFEKFVALEIPVVVGGPEVTANLDYVLRYVSAPFAIQGEGEETIVELLWQLQGEKSFEQIPGLTYWDTGKGRYITNRRRPWIHMDSVPLLPYELVDLDRYDRSYAEFTANKVEVLNTSRGCPFQCTFCSNKHVWSNKYRAMSPPRMLEHIRHALAATDATAIYFREDHFTLDAKRVRDFCQLILSSGLRFEWGCESRVNGLTPGLIKLMASAGLHSIWFGVESGSDEVLRNIHKGTTVEQVRNAVRLCRDAGVKVGFSVMLGLPGETRADLRKTIDLIFELKPDWVYWAAFVGLPGAALYEYLENHPELVFRRWHNLILPHNEIMSYPEKLHLKQNMELRFNLQPRILWGHLRRMGVRRFLCKAWGSIGRIVVTRFNQHNLGVRH